MISLRTIENENLKEVTRKWPRLFEIPTFRDDQKFLEKWGIFIPGKEKFFSGYLKLWPQDFIVEEISKEKKIQTIFPGPLFAKALKKNHWENKICWATLVKCGLSTIEAEEEIAQKLKISPKNIKFAGIKDKHAITSQLISIKEPSIEKIKEVNSSNFFLKEIFFKEKEIYLGQLTANQFTILVRTGHDFNSQQFLKRLEEISKNGFFNFFYLQRFGVPRLVAPYCGLSLLKGDYERTIFLEVCKSGEREVPYFQNLRKEIEKLWGNWEEIENILEFFPVTFREERKIISHLKENPNDFVGALQKVPRQVHLWIHSLSSLFFNKLIFSFIKEKKPLPESLPLFLSPDPKDWQLYKKLLNQVEIFSQAFLQKKLKPFPQIVFQKREINTREKVKILNYKIIPQGVILNFILPKGCYATTFLSHLFDLISGKLPKNFSNLPIDTKANLGQESLEEVLNRFTEVVSSPAWRYLWRIY